MLLFLSRDTVREYPVGFEKERRNIFDPEDDLDDSDESSSQISAASAANAIPGEAESETHDAIAIDEKSTNDADSKLKKTSTVCTRKGCVRPPRFDSLFCSDACGVSALELDLLYSLQESHDISPSTLRN